MPPVFRPTKMFKDLSATIVYSALWLFLFWMFLESSFFEMILQIDISKYIVVTKDFILRCFVVVYAIAGAFGVVACYTMEKWSLRIIITIVTLSIILFYMTILDYFCIVFPSKIFT